MIIRKFQKSIDIEPKSHIKKLQYTLSDLLDTRHNNDQYKKV